MAIRKIVHAHLCLLIGLVCVGAFFACEDQKPAKTVSDKEIQTAIMRRIIADAGVSGHLVDVTVTDGVVALTGSVDNLLARDRAGRLAQTIKGVRTVINNIIVRPVERLDSAIKRDVKRILTFDPAIDHNTINVEVSNGVVQLTGSADSWTEKQAVARAVKGVRGVTGIDSDIMIDYQEERSDAEIASEVKHRLAVDPYVDGSSIEVDVTEHVVTLRGIVGNEREKTYAYQDAWVSGVEDVVDGDLKVDWQVQHNLQRNRKKVSKSDDAIQEAIEDSFIYDPHISALGLNVDVDNGVVTLQGEVDNLMAKRNAGQNARNTIGVWRVVNMIKVTPDFALSNPVIAENVRQILTINPIVDRHAIEVTVRNNKVFLYGTVDTEYEKQYVEELVARVAGVADIQNSLGVLEVEQGISDQELEDAIGAELYWDTEVDEEDLNVSVVDGMATIQGTVDSWMEFDAVIYDSFQAGARVVRSRMAIAGENRTYPLYSDYSYYQWYF